MTDVELLGLQPKTRVRVTSVRVDMLYDKTLVFLWARRSAAPAAFAYGAFRALHDCDGQGITYLFANEVEMCEK